MLLRENLVPVHQPKVELPAIHYEMPIDFYLCYHCDGEGLSENSGLKSLCGICGGRGELNNDHKYVQRMKTLFATHVQKQPKRERREVPQPEPEVKIPEVKTEFPRVFKGLSKVFELSISELNKVEKMEVGKEFTYHFEIHNKGKDLPEEL